MPLFYNPAGLSCNVTDAMADGRLRPGFKQVLTEGDRVHFDVQMMDAQRSGAVAFFTDGSAISITDAERTFADSAEGHAAVARAAMIHRQSTGYLGDHAPAFTDQQAAQAIRDAVSQRSATKSVIDQQNADLPGLRIEAEVAHAAMVDSHNAWRR